MQQTGRWLVDGMNVIGSRPTGWWKDRDGAIRRFVHELRDYAQATGEAVTVVFDHRPEDMAAGVHDGVEVGFASRAGRDAADDEIVRRLQAESDPGAIRVVTSDSALAHRVQGLGAEVVSSGAFRRRMEDPPVAPR